MSIRIGCSGWSYEDWVGPFYPKDTAQQDFLRLYSQVFDCVEIDSTFYRAPSTAMVQHWDNATPPNFIFAPKVPKRITHDQKLENVTSYMQYFVKTAGALGDKLGPFVVQLPPSFSFPKHERALKEFIANLDLKRQYAIEFRNKSWFTSEVEKLLHDANICQVWSVNQYLTTPASITADFIYLRLVGDRELTEFDRVQKDQATIMKTWSKNVQDAEDSAKKRFIFFNNHFAGFGPASANEFRRLMGLVELDWSGLKEGGDQQKTLFDFSKNSKLHRS